MARNALDLHSVPPTSNKTPKPMETDENKDTATRQKAKGKGDTESSLLEHDTYAQFLRNQKGSLLHKRAEYKQRM